MGEIQIEYSFHLYFWSSPGHSGETVFLLRETKDIGQLFYYYLLLLLLKLRLWKEITGQEENEYNSDYWIVRMRQANTTFLCLDYWLGILNLAKFKCDYVGWHEMVITFSLYFSCLSKGPIKQTCLTLTQQESSGKSLYITVNYLNSSRLETPAKSPVAVCLFWKNQRQQKDCLKQLFAT